MEAKSQAVLPVLAALARGVLGDRYIPEVPERMLESIAQLPAASDRKQILGVLRASNTRAGALALTGRPIPVTWLTVTEAEAVIQRWKRSRLAQQRQLALVVAALAASSFYSYPGAGWTRIGYEGPLGPPPDEPRRLDPIEVHQHEVINCDFVIVGSGAGGGCAAAVLSEAGHDVVVLEKGGYKAERDFTHIEPDARRDMYLYGLKLTTTDLGVQILAGSTLGGGTVVNYSTSIRTPEPTLQEWARISGLDGFINGEIDAALDASMERLGVNFDSSAAGKRDEKMEEGLKALGWDVGLLPRAVRGCPQDEGCGYCGFGCRRGAKQSSMRTWLEDAAEHGARMIIGVDARRVRISDGKASGVEAVANGHRLIVNARKAVIVAGGAIETPALLLRSGLRGQVGHNLRLHPGTAAFARFDEDIRIWEGTLMARVSREFVDWDGGYGPLFETVPVHPGEASQAIPWSSAEDHARRMDDLARTGFVAVLPRDQGIGRIKISREGVPRVHYRLTPGDERRLMEGVVRAGQVMEAAGAKEIQTLHHHPISYVPDGDGAHERWADEVRRRGYGRGTTTMFSYHQMGSCRMGRDPSTSAIDGENQSHEVKDLYVMDSSAFPTASGVNPMMSIYGIAHRAASRLAARHS